MFGKICSIIKVPKCLCCNGEITNTTNCVLIISVTDFCCFMFKLERIVWVSEIALIAKLDSGGPNTGKLTVRVGNTDKYLNSTKFVLYVGFVLYEKLSAKDFLRDICSRKYNICSCCCRL